MDQSLNVVFVFKNKRDCEADRTELLNSPEEG